MSNEFKQKLVRQSILVVPSAIDHQLCDHVRSMWNESLSDDTSRKWAQRVQRGVASHEFTCAELDSLVWSYVDDPRAEQDTAQPRLLRYIGSPSNQGYPVHTDHRNHRRDRLVSLIVMLSDRCEYTGGILNVDQYGDCELNKGDIVVFPSDQLHGVSAITRGFRYVANYMWVGNR